MFGAHDAVIGAEVAPELVEDVGAFNEDEEREDKNENEFGDEVAECADGSHEVIAEVVGELGGVFLDRIDDLAAEIVDAEVLAEVVESGAV